jgi:hypothetical protein
MDEGAATPLLPRSGILDDDDVATIVVSRICWCVDDGDNNDVNVDVGDEIDRRGFSPFAIAINRCSSLSPISFSSLNNYDGVSIVHCKQNSRDMVMKVEYHKIIR